MKLYHFTIIFAVFLLAMIVIVEMRISEQSYIAADSSETEHAFDDAVDSAVEALAANMGTIEAGGRDAAVNAFLSSLYASLGIVDSPKAKRDMELYIPVIAVTVGDGFYVWYSAEYTDADGFKAVSRIWSPKIAYSYDDGYFIYGFSSGTKATVFDYNCYFDTAPAYYSADAGNIADFEYFDELIHSIPAAEWTSCLLTNENLFTSVRSSVVAQTLEDNLNYYCNAHNRVGENAGITYQFHIPEVDGSVYLRAASSPSFLAFMQGYPIKGTSATYNRYAVSNAQVVSNEIYTIDDQLLYHRAGCSHIGTEVSSAYSKEDCAEQGAFACPYCFPNTGAKKTW